MKVTTIDNLFYKKKIPLSYLKADLEGYEIKMLIGAYQTIKKYKPKIAITTYHEKEHASWIANYLRQIDPQYRVKCVGLENKWGVPVMLHAWVEEKKKV